MRQLTNRPGSGQYDLFGEPVVSGLAQGPEIVSPAEEQALIAAIDESGLSPFRFHGFLGKRLTKVFGWRYDFDDGGFGPADPIPQWLLSSRQKAASFSGLGASDLVQALLIRYDPGAGIGWHRDRPVFGHVIGISLGAPATLRFRRRRAGGFDRASALLAPRSVYHLAGEARHDWEHGIEAIAATRWSITFRSLADLGRGAKSVRKAE
jgi:alkylated DNA repair protein (DNA oxidative demethylase)